MDRPANPTTRRLLAVATMEELLRLREVAWQAGLLNLSRAAAVELRERTASDLETRLRPYRATLRRIP